MPPLNLVGDFGGGALYLVVGVLAALLEASKSGKGQVVDAAMCDGAASLMSFFFDMTTLGRWTEGRNQNFLDGGAHFYGVYECACGHFVSIGSIEPQFYALLREHAGLTDADFDAQMDPKAWPALKEKLKTVFKSKTREDWCKIMEGTDICFAPVLTMSEATEHPHMVARECLRRAPRRETARAGAALLAHAVGGARAGRRGDCRGDGCVESGPLRRRLRVASRHLFASLRVHASDTRCSSVNQTDRPPPSQTMRVGAAILGNALEFYDFTVYAAFAVWLAKAFFPADNPNTSLLLTVATFGVGFVARPLGGILIGAYADRYGRKPAMTLTIWLMALGTGMIGLLPTYDQIGLLAPVLLVLARLLQGFSTGGEMGPATTYLLRVRLHTARVSSEAGSSPARTWAACSRRWSALAWRS